jgi:hypothetical protein
MDKKMRRRHLHASVGAATVYGMVVGFWLGTRMGSAGWIESIAFFVLMMVAPGIIMSRIDSRFGYSD